MARYIDADILTEAMKYYHGHTNKDSGEHYAYGVVLKEIDRTPTADVVEVVRCRDCKHATFYRCKNDPCYNSINCEYQIGIGDEDFFCSCGERRTDNDV